MTDQPVSLSDIRFKCVSVTVKATTTSTGGTAILQYSDALGHEMKIPLDADQVFLFKPGCEYVLALAPAREFVDAEALIVNPDDTNDEFRG